MPPTAATAPWPWLSTAKRTASSSYCGVGPLAGVQTAISSGSPTASTGITGWYLRSFSHDTCAAPGHLGTLSNEGTWDLAQQNRLKGEYCQCELANAVLAPIQV